MVPKTIAVLAEPPRRRSERPTVVTGFGPRPPALPADVEEEVAPPVVREEQTRPTVPSDRLEKLVELATGKPVANRATVVNTHVKQVLKRAVDSERNIAFIAESPEATALSAVAQTFPSLVNAPGTEPWDARKLVAWLNDPAHGGSHAFWSGRFLLAAAEPDRDWTTVGLRSEGRFDLFAALASWDAEHKRAFSRWLQTLV
jgi:hypothetical protein